MYHRLKESRERRARISHREFEVYAPHGYDDLFNQRLRPNPVMAPRHVYERKAARWVCEWPGLSVEPWPCLDLHRPK